MVFAEEKMFGENLIDMQVSMQSNDCDSREHLARHGLSTKIDSHILPFRQGTVNKFGLSDGM